MMPSQKCPPSVKVPKLKCPDPKPLTWNIPIMLLLFPRLSRKPFLLMQWYRTPLKNLSRCPLPQTDLKWSPLPNHCRWMTIPDWSPNP